MSTATLKAYAWQALAALLAAALLLQTAKLSDAREGHAKYVADVVQRAAETDRTLKNLSEKYRTLEGTYHENIATTRASASAAIAAATADAGRARTAAAGLQRDLAEYITAHRRAAQDRTATGQCAPDTAAVDLLADLQRRADARAGELADVADQARARGTACEREHDAAAALMEATHAQAR